MQDAPTTLSTDQLWCRSQFILGPSFADELKSWKRIRINDSIFLTVHPSLLTSRAVYLDKSMTLLGFMIDPGNPDASDSDIVDGLVRSFAGFDDLFECTARFGGRWILIVNDGQETRLFNDAAGLRQVFYTDADHVRQVWCASQPGMIARVLNLQMDGEAIDFISWFRLREAEYWWPGESSPYKEIKHLLPNHYLDSGTGRCHRYWPNRGFEELSLDGGIEKISRILLGLMQSASNRFDLALGLSAGWDSRLVLASCREIRHRISFYSARRPEMSENHPDVEVPSRLLSRLGLKHDMIDQTAEVKTEFVDIFNSSVPFAHKVRAFTMQANLDYYHQGKVGVTGNVSEVARCFYRLPESDEQVLTAAKLSSLAGMENHPFAVRFFEKWRSGLGEVHNFNVLDLFYWEQRIGNWFAMNCLEFDIAWQDIYIPFNTRRLLIDLLSVDERYRRPPKYQLYRKLISSLWPEVLCEPINPHKKKGLKYFRKRGLMHLRRTIGYPLKRLRASSSPRM